MKSFIKKLGAKIKYGFEYLLNVDWTSSFMLGRLPFTLRGMKWEMHITDADIFPSTPHLHAIEDARYTINVYNGEVYWDKKSAGKLRDKELQLLWNDQKFLDMLKKSRKYYIVRNPGRTLPEYPCFIKKELLDDLKLNINIANETLVLTAEKIRKDKKRKKSLNKK